MTKIAPLIILIACGVALISQASAKDQYPFQNPDLPIEKRIDNILSLMTIDEKIECLDTNPNVPRLGIKGSGHVEGIHGLTQGGPGKWGRPQTVPSTTFPQGIGLGETWDKEILRQAGQNRRLRSSLCFSESEIQPGRYRDQISQC
jgi:beta-glucosidase